VSKYPRNYLSEEHGEKCDELTHPSFTNRFSPTLFAVFREILDDAIGNLDSGRDDLRGRLEHFQDLLIADATTPVVVGFLGLDDIV
jgi:hypothetical protein